MMQFNTYRAYSPEGQIIEYSTVSQEYGAEEWCKDYIDYTVFFNDTTRCIKGYVEFTTHKDDNSSRSIQNRIMDKYDKGEYTDADYYDKMKQIEANKQ